MSNISVIYHDEKKMYFD